MRVSELCTRDVAVTTRLEPLLDAARRMRSEHVGDLVVVEERAGARVPVGILTDRDIVVGVIAGDVDHLRTLEVGDVMSEDVVTAADDEDVEHVIARMRAHGIRRVPVVDPAGSLVGVLSLDDVISSLADALAAIAAVSWRQRAHEPARRP